jgi:type IV pilus assembly protein PilB
MEPRFAELLVKGSVVTREQLAEAQKKERENGSSVTKEIVRLGFTNEETLSQFLAKQFGIEIVDLVPGDVEDTVFSIVPPQIIQKHQLIPYKLVGSTLTVAMADPTDLVAINEVKFITGYGVRVILSTHSAIKKTLDHRFGGVNLDDVLKKFGDGEMEVVQESDDIDLQELQQATMDAPVVTLVNAILADAAKRRCSDIHIEPYEKVFRVRFRLDGMLQEIMSPPLRLKNALVSRLKVMAGLDIAERRLTQDGRIKLKMTGGELDIRVSILPTLFGEKVCMRLLDKSNLQLDMSKLGFDPQNQKDFQDAIHKPYGMILITGPTGSGKSTTLYSALSDLNKPDVNISTAEDPVEYNLMGINQVQVRDQIGLTFAAALRSFLRQDPDIIMVGEMRDLETAQIAIKAALTGHLVLSTLHTNDCSATVDRLLNMGVEGFLLTSSINLILAQRLVRKICDKCKEPVETSPEVLINLGVDSAEVSAGFPTFHGKGCGNCSDTGYRGRLAVYEVMVMHEALKELILKGASAMDLKRDAVKHGMRTLRMSALQKVKDGLTTIDETIRVTDTDKGFGSVFALGF